MFKSTTDLKKRRCHTTNTATVCTNGGHTTMESHKKLSNTTHGTDNDAIKDNFTRELFVEASTQTVPSNNNNGTSHQNWKTSTSDGKGYAGKFIFYSIH